MNDDTIAPLDRDFVEVMLQHVTAGQSKAGFGVTLQEDHNGAWGQMGKRYLTVRFMDPNDRGDMIEVMMEVVSVSSSKADEEMRREMAEDK